MRQIIIDFGKLDLFGLNLSLRIYGYGLMMVLGFLSAIAIGRWRARRMGENPDVIMQIGVLSLVGGVLGARLAYVIQHWDTQFSRSLSLGDVLNISSGGLIYYGGLVLAGVTVLAYLKLKRLPIRRHLDMVAVSLMVGLAFGRAGCLLNGCCYGGPCGHDWALGTEFPMFSKPLLKFDGHDSPYSQDQDGPSPVYHHQLTQRAAKINADGGKDHPDMLGNAKADSHLVSPPPQLAHFRPFDRAMVDASGKKADIPTLGLHPPGELHGKLQRSQLDAALMTEEQARAAFEALAGADEQLDADEWRKGLAAGEGLLGGSEHWNEALRTDRSRDGKLDFPEFRAYTDGRLGALLKRFDENGNGALAAAEADRANAFLQADEIALAEASHALPVKPAQMLGIVNALLLAGILTVFYRMRTREGQVFALLLVLYPITRFILEAIRDDNPHNLSAGLLTHNQKTSLAMALGGVLVMVLLRRLPAGCGPSWARRLADAGNASKT